MMKTMKRKTRNIKMTKEWLTKMTLIGQIGKTNLIGQTRNPGRTSLIGLTKILGQRTPTRKIPGRSHSTKRNPGRTNGQKVDKYGTKCPLLGRNTIIIESRNLPSGANALRGTEVVIV